MKIIPRMIRRSSILGTPSYSGKYGSIFHIYTSDNQIIHGNASSALPLNLIILAKIIPLLAPEPSEPYAHGKRFINLR